MGELMNLLIKYLKKIILSGFMLFTYNLIANTFNLTIPINFITIIFVGLFDIVGLVTLILIKFIGL